MACSNKKFFFIIVLFQLVTLIASQNTNTCFIGSDRAAMDICFTNIKNKYLGGRSGRGRGPKISLIKEPSDEIKNIESARRRLFVRQKARGGGRGRGGGAGGSSGSGSASMLVSITILECKHMGMSSDGLERLKSRMNQLLQNKIEMNPESITMFFQKLKETSC